MSIRITRGSFLRSIAGLVSVVMLLVTGFFILAVGLLIAGFMVALPVMDVWPQVISLKATGWKPVFAWAFSVGTSAMPVVYSFTRDRYPVKDDGEIVINHLVYHLFFWGLRLLDATLDAMGIGVVMGAADKPSFAYLVHASMYQILTVLVMFVMSNVTDEMKGAVVVAAQQYTDFVNEIIHQTGAVRRSATARRARPNRPSAAGVASLYDVGSAPTPPPAPSPRRRGVG